MMCTSRIMPGAVGRVLRTRLAAAVALAMALLPAPHARAQGEAQSLHYDLDVKVRDGDLAVTETIRMAGGAPTKLALELAQEMKVLAVESGGNAVPFAAGRDAVELDLSSVASAGAECSVTLRLEGSPREQFPASRGGRVPSAVGPDLVYIRSQVPWYARLPEGLATYRTVVDVRAGWRVRTAGAAQPPRNTGDRDVFTFETASPEPRIGLAAGPWHVRELAAGGGVLFDVFHVPGKESGADALLAGAKRAFEYYGAWLGKVPLTRFTLVEMPEAFGASSGYGESGYILLGPGAFASPPGPGALPLVAHEVSHTWWGHAVMFSEWPNEALAEFMTMKFIEADQGDDAARADRRSSVEEVLRAAEAGKEVALADIRGFGGGMDPETYASHAYGKGKMLLVMMEDAVGEAAMKRALAKFLDDNRGRTVGWPDLRAALVGIGSAAKAVIEQWENPGVPRLSLDLTKPGSGKSGRVVGTLRQEGTPKPYRMKVVIGAKCGEKLVTTSVALDGAKASFRFAVPSEPLALLVDPDWRLLAARSAPSGVDPGKLFDEAMKVANNPAQDDSKLLEDAIAKLRTVIEAGSPDLAGTCHVGIGRCLFNLGKLDDAKKELEEGLRVGCGPFHRAWANLRLGNIADLQKRRKDALKYYEVVVAGPAAKNLDFQKERARRFLDNPYRGFKQDG